MANCSAIEDGLSDNPRNELTEKSFPCKVMQFDVQFVI
jgi:hypothetical protein